MSRMKWVPVFIALLFGTAVCNGQSASSPANTRLFSKIYGCEAAVTIGNAMGVPVEGWTWEKIEQTYGFLDKFVAEEKRQNDRVTPQRFGPPWVSRAHQREPGWTEDGMERYKLLVAAIIKKGGRINIEDLAREWTESIDPAKFGYNLGSQDMIIYNLLKAGMPPWEVGRYAMWPGFMGTSKMIIPIGVVNACRPDNAARDALEVTRIKDTQGRPIWRDDKFGPDGTVRSRLIWDDALEVAAAIAAATAEALRPNATADSVIATALAQLPAGSRSEVETVLGYAKNARDWKEIRPLYAKFFETRPISNAVDVLAGGLACFRLAKGQPRGAILYAVNLGRDTDCKAYVAGGLAGALCGIEAVPKEWVATVEKAVLTDPYTVSKRTARQAAEGLYQAALNEMRKSKAADSELESMVAN
jgi:ADP-ribosylglycohydrolase